MFNYNAIYSFRSTGLFHKSIISHVFVISCASYFVKMPQNDCTSTTCSVIGGSYLYMDRAQMLPGLTSELSFFRAILMSRVLTYSQFSGGASVSAARCFSFWYHMTGYGQESCVLRVKVTRGQDSSDLTVWSQNARYKDSWRRVAVDINALTPYHVSPSTMAYKIVNLGSISKYYFLAVI